MQLAGDADDTLKIIRQWRILIHAICRGAQMKIPDFNKLVESVEQAGKKSAVK